MPGSGHETQAPPRLSHVNVAPPLRAAGVPVRVSVMRAVVAVVLALGLALLWMVWRAVVLSQHRLDVAPLDTAPVDAERVAHALAQTIRHQTISTSSEAPPAAEAFEALQAELSELFPRVHASLERERVRDHSLLHTWRGSVSALAPVILVAHQA